MRVIKEKIKQILILMIYIYILDNELSTDKTKVYVDKNTNDIATMVNRGTSDFKDVMTDAKLLFWYMDKRFNEPKEILDTNKQK